MKEAPAILIFKDYTSVLKMLTTEECGRLLRAIVDYLDGNECPDYLADKEKIIFTMLKADFMRNEEEYEKKKKQRQEYQRNYYQDKISGKTMSTEAEERKSEKPPTKPPTGKKSAKNNEKQLNLTRAQAEFFASFKEHFPNKAIDCQISEYPNIDYTALVLEMKKSPQFLKLHDNLTLKWCLTHAEDIIKGKYRQHEDQYKPNFKQREYSDEFLNSLAQDINEIEI